MLLCGIMDELEKIPTNRLSYFFCQATEQKLDNATAVLRGLVYTLVRRHPTLISHVRKEYVGGGKQRFEGLNAWQAMSHILEAMLNDPILTRCGLLVPQRYSIISEDTTDHRVHESGSALRQVACVYAARALPFPRRDPNGFGPLGMPMKRGPTSGLP